MLSSGENERGSIILLLFLLCPCQHLSCSFPCSGSAYCCPVLLPGLNGFGVPLGAVGLAPLYLLLKFSTTSIFCHAYHSGSPQYDALEGGILLVVLLSARGHSHAVMEAVDAPSGSGAGLFIASRVYSGVRGHFCGHSLGDGCGSKGGVDPESESLL